jgi:hypothetical protein
MEDRGPNAPSRNRAKPLKNKVFIDANGLIVARSVAAGASSDDAPGFHPSTP